MISWKHNRGIGWGCAETEEFLQNIIGFLMGSAECLEASWREVADKEYCTWLRGCILTMRK